MPRIASDWLWTDLLDFIGGSSSWYVSFCVGARPNAQAKRIEMNKDQQSRGLRCTFAKQSKLEISRFVLTKMVARFARLIFAKKMLHLKTEQIHFPKRFDSGKVPERGR